ncbi:DoxX family protein [Paenibacillus sp. GCM10023252]|uniref:DoxX family protein n=1 Tax=Paenibacillus sp. GCM10023252 TaxID=3252649 RepID=UPI00361F878C
MTTSTILNSENAVEKVRTGSRGRTIAYWTVTGFFAAALTMSGIGQLVPLEGNVVLVENLGYPEYILAILGIWKLLGVIAIVIPGVPRLKEWAYAGFFFLMTGAALSHVLAGDDAFSIILPLAYAALAITSWALRPQSRRL